MKRFLMEFYDADGLENIIPLLHEHFDGVTYFFFPDEAPDARAKLVLAECVIKLSGVTPAYVQIEEKSFEAVAAAFEKRIDEKNTFVFDITGGSELFIAAAGYFLRERGGANTYIHLYDVRKNRRIFSFPEQTEESSFGGKLTFDDLVSLYGGKILSIAGGANYDFSDKLLRQEILRLWNAARLMPSEWNRFCSLPAEVRTKAVNSMCKKLMRTGDREVCEKVMASLVRQRIVRNWSVVNSGGQSLLYYELSDMSKTRALYDKGGTILEMYTCLAASECEEFSDCCTGAVIDLDGVITKMPNDPKNEIDVCMMCGNCAVFGSCKNTQPTKEFLYEIATVTRDIGGAYAVPMLVSTQPALSAVKERAKELGIILIDNVYATNLNDMKYLISHKYQKLQARKHGGRG